MGDRASNRLRKDFCVDEKVAEITKTSGDLIESIQHNRYRRRGAVTQSSL